MQAGTDAAQVIAVLDAVHDALSQRRFADLGTLADRLEAAVTQTQAATDAATLAAIRARADRNAAALAATGRGLKAALRRLDEVAQARRGAGVYGADGSRPTCGPTTHNLLHRA